MAKEEDNILENPDGVSDDAIDEGGTGYHVSLDVFDGPLDLLLRLIKLAKIDIKDIFVSNVTEQYLSFMEGLDELDMDKATDFILMAATLIEIKAREIIPKPETTEETDEEDAKAELIRKLEEYELYKQETEKLKEKETVSAWFRLPDPNLADETVVIKDMTMDGILAALKKIYARAEKKSAEILSKEIVRDPFTVEEKQAFIQHVIDEKLKIKFIELFDEDATKNEVITTFQALLELMKSQYIVAEQDETFDDIFITKKMDGDNS
ncbi:MAG: segregation/condensation protein A [Clostridia bacterium]|nr:segregation/condensation protein A [Clostridia bacterium]MBP5593242.1 segregation/condensation protein A [Clostridia bacterium]MBP5649351.1 segregation/condensation protein A [Clostridia bacterium]